MMSSNERARPSLERQQARRSADSARAAGMRILVLIDQEAADHRDLQFKGRKTQDTAAVEWHVVSALRQLGHDVSVLPLAEQPARAIRSLQDVDTDLVFNLTEQVAGDRRKDAYVAALLERLRLPYTGAGPDGLALCRDKARSKRRLKRAGIAVPEFEVLVVGQRRFSRRLRFPVLVKPLMADASEEMARPSLAFSAKKALRRVAFLHRRTGHPAICEEFIDGREIKIPLLGNGHPVVLPPREVCFGGASRGGPVFITSRVKGDPSYRRAWNITYPHARLSAEEMQRVTAVAVATYRLLQMRDYGKIDARLTPEGQVVVLEANPNPDLAPQGFGRMAAWGGLDYNGLIGRIVALAAQRRKTAAGPRGRSR
jgi:D-alanine-D-alanine ligase